MLTPHTSTSTAREAGRRMRVIHCKANEHITAKLEDELAVFENDFNEWTISVWRAKSGGFHFAAHDGWRTSVSSKTESPSQNEAYQNAYKAISDLTSKAA